jgi:hypothetical protein
MENTNHKQGQVATGIAVQVKGISARVEHDPGDWK